MSINIKQFINRAERARQKGNFESARRYANEVAIREPNNYDALLILGLSELALRNYVAALDCGLRLRALFPSHPNGTMIASVALMNMRRNRDAVQVLEEQLRKDPQNRALLFNLHSAYGGMDDAQSALKVALDTVAFHPTDSDAYNNLGASLSNVGRPLDAKIAFQTAVELNPSNLTAKLNLIHVSFRQDGNDTELIDELTSIGSSLSSIDVQQKRILTGAIHNSAFAYFRTGRLSEGWDALEAGLSPEIDSNRGRKPNRSFKAKRWRGEPLNGRALMVWREQGLGDEIMFGTMLPELKKIDGNVIIECEPRLVQLLANSFPEFSVRSELYRAVFPFDSPREDFDLQIPIASLGGIYRMSRDKFPAESKYLIPIDDEVYLISERLRSVRANKKYVVGLCWRSGVVSPTRGANYTLLEDWRRLFEREDVCVVNLQYGKCEDELQQFERVFNVEILRWTDISLQNDLSMVAAIVRNLDYVFSIGSAVAQMAGAVGTKTGLVAPKPVWTSFGTLEYPFHRSISLFCDPNGIDILPAVEACIDNFNATFH
jgi:hypothetical protein